MESHLLVSPYRYPVTVCSLTVGCQFAVKWGMRFLSFIGAMLCIVVAVFFTTLDYGWIVSAGLVILAPYFGVLELQKAKAPGQGGYILGRRQLE